MGTTTTKLDYEVVRSGASTEHDEYRVEAIGHEDEGQVYVAIFSGPKAQERAEEYAKFKNNGHR